jgi:cytochrome P450 family 6
LEKYEDEISFDSIAEMEYLDMVLNETLRKWPINNVQFRKASNEFQISNSNLKIPSETFITIPVYSVHRDERFYENPNKFLPNRFSEEAIKNRHKMAFIPFSEGLRKCLGRILYDDYCIILNFHSF